MCDLSETNDSSELASPVPEYYVIDYSKVSLSELWSLCGTKPSRWSFMIEVLAAKILHRPMRSGPPVLLYNVRIIDLAEIPDEIRRDIEAIIRSLEPMGFKRILAVSLIMAKRVTGFAAVLLSADGLYWARVDAFQGGNDDRLRNHLAFYTRRRDGHWLCTTTSHLQYKDDASARERLPGASPDQLLQRHRRRVLDCTDAQPIREADLRDSFVKSFQRFDCEKEKRHGFVPATTAEIQQYHSDIFIPGE
jgi:hypothetical protein